MWVGYLTGKECVPTGRGTIPRPQPVLSFSYNHPILLPTTSQYFLRPAHSASHSQPFLFPAIIPFFFLQPASFSYDQPIPLPINIHFLFPQKLHSSSYIQPFSLSTTNNQLTSFLLSQPAPCSIHNLSIPLVRDGHGGGWSRKINAWHLYTLMVYL